MARNRRLWDCPDCIGKHSTITEHRAPLFTHSDGCVTGRALDAVSDLDRAYFAEHPEATEYWRDLMPGDLAIGSLGCVSSADGRPMLVRVRQVAEGVRVRRIPSNVFISLESQDGQRVAALLGLLPVPQGAA